MRLLDGSSEVTKGEGFNLNLEGKNPKVWSDELYDSFNQWYETIKRKIKLHLKFDGDDHQILDVISYENDELGNDDIFDFIKKIYRIDIVKNSDEFKTWLEKIFQTSVDNLFGYWLTSKDSCIALYTDTLDDEITELTLPMDYLILSDLSVDGCLIVTNQPKSDNENVQTKFVKDI